MKLEIKTKKFTWVVLGTALFVAVLVALLIPYRGQVAAQQAAINQIRVLQQRAAGFSPGKLSQQQTQLKNQLDGINNSIKDAQAAMTHPLNSIQDSNTIIQLTQSAGVRLVEVNTLDPADGLVAQVPFRYLPLMLIVEGELEQVNQCVRQLGEAFPTCRFSTVDITATTTEDGETSNVSVARIEMEILGVRE